METDDEQSVPEFINDDLGDGFDDDNDSDNSGSFWRGATNINRQRFFEFKFGEPWHCGENYVSPIKGSWIHQKDVYFNTTICKVLHEGRKSFRLLVAQRDNETASIVVKMMTDDNNVNYINIKVTSTISNNTEGVLVYKYSKPNNLLANDIDDSKIGTIVDSTNNHDDDKKLPFLEKK